jgi:tRNA(Ile)-lysidine synthase
MRDEMPLSNSRSMESKGISVASCQGAQGVPLESRIRKELEGPMQLHRGEVLVAAVSGGVDSMVLLDLLARLRLSLGFALHVAHVDHALRSASAADADWVATRAGDYGLRFHRHRVDVARYASEGGLSLEAAGREVRYDFFNALARRLAGARVVLGHHADDQAETVLMRMLRGSGPTGLAAMHRQRQGYLRPLLQVGRAEISAYAASRALAYRQDETNEDTRFRRNRIRHHLLPLLRRDYNPGVDRVLRRTAEILAGEDEYMAAETDRAWPAVCLAGAGTYVVLAAPKLLNYHIAMRRRLVRRALTTIRQSSEGLSFEVVESVLGLLGTGQTAWRSLPGGLYMQLSGEYLILRAPSPLFAGCDLSFPGAYRLGAEGWLKGRYLPVAAFGCIRPTLGKWKAVFDADRLGAGLRVRRPQAGDRFCPLGLKGRKKLSDMLIDAKWPRILRDEVLLVTQDDQIIWGIGLQPAEEYKVRSDTKQLLLLEMEGHIWDIRHAR